ncbi:MAG: hypothetical protein HOI41_22850 [Acidimicrobiaceae bacterium]|nr:hypothetical protein [Acidimicrobiaceae bacterium]
MATRPPRLKRPHTYFHVTTQGTNRWNIFLDDNDRRRFMYLLIATCERYRIEVQAFCLMGNHVHLVLYCPEPVLSAAMRDLKSRYAKYFRRYHKSSGPLFEAPFLEVPILTDEHLMTEVRYTHRNPLDLDATVCLATCQWSSHGIYLGLRPEPSFMNTSVVRELFGPNYRLEVERPRPNDKVHNRVRPIIDVPKVTSPGEHNFSVGKDWSLAGIKREIANAANCELVDVRPRCHNGLLGLAVAIALDLGRFTPSEIAEPYGYSSAQAVQMAARRTRRRLEDHDDLRRVHHLVQQRHRRAA